MLYRLRFIPSLALLQLKVMLNYSSDFLMNCTLTLTLKPDETVKSGLIWTIS